MNKKYALMFEPLPGGWKYGFPRALPQEAVLGKGADLWINPAFDIIKYVAGFGFPADELHKWKLYPQEVKDMCGGVYEDELKEESTNEKMGDIKFTTAKDFMDEQKEYVYPGSDCQE